MKTRLLGGVVALVLAIAGAVLLSSYVRASDARAQAGMEPVQILVVQQPIAAGTAVKDFGQSVTLQSIPKSAVPEGAVGNLAEYAGRVAAVDLVAGEQLLAARLVDPKALVSPNRVEVPKGLSEVSVLLPADRVLGGDIKAGDTVGVFISYEAGDKRGENVFPATKLQFHKVLVTKVGWGDGSPAKEGEASNQSQTAMLVTLAQSGADAAKVVHGVEFGHIYLSKENTDSSDAPVDSFFQNQVLR